MIARLAVVVLLLGCDLEAERERHVESLCSASGRRDVYAYWLRACLDESGRGAVECETFAGRQEQADAEAWCRGRRKQ